MKYKLTSKSKMYFGVKLYQIEALKDFANINKGDKGGWIEKESNLEQYGDAWVSGNARVSLKASFIKGWFIGGDDTGKITDITDKTGSTYWKNQYVLGDYEITPIEDEKKEIETIEIGGIKYSKSEVEAKLKDIKPI